MGRGIWLRLTPWPAELHGGRFFLRALACTTICSTVYKLSDYEAVDQIFCDRYLTPIARFIILHDHSNMLILFSFFVPTGNN